MPSPVKIGRVTKLSVPKGTIRKGNYRERAFDSLMVDFESRCAYSMQHSKRVGEDGLQVDHFNPTKKKDSVQEYANLFPAIVHCNGRKADYWPQNIGEYDAGKRILNPRREQDYDLQIVEVKETGMLLGLTPAARFHIYKLDLNVEFLRIERRNRTEHLQLTGALAGVTAIPQMTEMRSNLQTETTFMIPPIRFATPDEILAAQGRLPQ